jgi:hypothetical protein
MISLSRQACNPTASTLGSEHNSHTLDVGYYSSEARTSINPVVSELTIRARRTIDIDLLPAVENPDSWRTR